MVSDLPDSRVQPNYPRGDRSGPHLFFSSATGKLSNPYMGSEFTLAAVPPRNFLVGTKEWYLLGDRLGTFALIQRHRERTQKRCALLVYNHLANKWYQYIAEGAAFAAQQMGHFIVFREAKANENSRPEQGIELPPEPTGRVIIVSLETAGHTFPY